MRLLTVMFFWLDAVLTSSAASQAYQAAVCQGGVPRTVGNAGRPLVAQDREEGGRDPAVMAGAECRAASI